jgi:hypothetical protein
VALDGEVRDSEVLPPFVALDSEIGFFPIEEARLQWNDEALRHKDRRLKAMLELARPDGEILGFVAMVPVLGVGRT